MSKGRIRRDLLLRSISKNFQGADIMPYLIRAFEVGYDEGFVSHSKSKTTTDLEKIPDWILVRDLSRKVESLEQALYDTRKELEESKCINGEKLHKASIEIQREKLYNKQQIELNKWRRKAQEYARAIGSLKAELKRLKGII